MSRQNSILPPSDPLGLLGVVPPGPRRARSEARLPLRAGELVPIGDPVFGPEPHGNPIMAGPQYPVQGPAGDVQLLPRARIADPLDEGIDGRMVDAGNVLASWHPGGLRTVDHAQVVAGGRPTHEGAARHIEVVLVHTLLV